VPPQAVALVGPSGSGKSSVLSLLLGLSADEGGRISWVGEPLVRSRHRACARRWRVSQEAAVLSGTVAGISPARRAGRRRRSLWRALERANAAAFVRAFRAASMKEVGERGGKLFGRPAPAVGSPARF
jgi:ABC-type transport system involved in cytochrome bd biosynthesis fused ATPase/permease subunit